MKVALDTNVVASAVATRGLCADIIQATLAEHALVLGEAVRTELSRVLRQKIRVPPDTIQELDTFLRGQAILVSAAPALPIKIRDPADRVVLAEAIAGKADVLVTGDRDLLDIAARAPIPILSPRGFWDLLRNPTGETK
jgi:putative PIN family toxin of toxin-antitoxin system